MSSSFSSTARETVSFSIAASVGAESHPPAAIDGVPMSIKPVGEVSLQVVLRLDENPDEVGYAIADAAGKTIVDVPPGSIRKRNSTLKQAHVMNPGVYTFTIFDGSGIGIRQPVDSAAYEVLRMDDKTNPTIISGNDNFQERRAHTFVLEGDHASVPITINVDNGDELAGGGFHLERLDLAEADAVVATVTPGADKRVSKRLLVEHGGLYRLKLLHNEEGPFVGNTTLEMGRQADLKHVNINTKPKFIASSNSSTLTGLRNDDANEGGFLSLSIPSQLDSRQIDWVLLALSVEGWGSEGKAYTKRQVVAFGPNNKNSTTNSHETFRKNQVETIPLPPFDGKQTFMLIFSHSRGEADTGSPTRSGLIQLFHGSPEDNVVLIGTSFEGESRLVEMFNLVGTGHKEVEEPPQTSLLGTGGLVLGMVIVCAYLLVRSFAKNKL